MITLIVLFVGDLQRSREFYSLLGLSFVEEQHDGGPVHYAATLPGGCVLELYPAGDRPVTRTRLGFAVVDVASTVEALVAAGFTVRDGVAVDPNGSQVELRGRPGDEENTDADD